MPRSTMGGVEVLESVDGMVGAWVVADEVATQIQEKKQELQVGWGGASAALVVCCIVLCVCVCVGGWVCMVAPAGWCGGNAHMSARRRGPPLVGPDPGPGPGVRSSAHPQPCCGSRRQPAPLVTKHLCRWCAGAPPQEAADDYQRILEELQELAVAAGLPASPTAAGGGTAASAEVGEGAGVDDVE